MNTMDIMMDIIVDTIEKESDKCSESLQKHRESKDFDHYIDYLKHLYAADVLIKLANRCLES